MTTLCTLPGPLVDASWLAEHLEDVRVVDTRWYLRPTDGRTGAQAFAAGHLPGAVFLDVDTDEDSASMLKWLDIPRAETPILVHATEVMRNPSAAQVARSLHLRADVDGERFDMVVLGGGPAGLAAAVYGGSEGLRTFVAEAWAPGGQAGTSTRIENYLGFPTGISGSLLTAIVHVRMAEYLRWWLKRASDIEIEFGGQLFRETFKKEDESRKYIFESYMAALALYCLVAGAWILLLVAAKMGWLP